MSNHQFPMLPAEDDLLDTLAQCRLCPRRCGADRLHGNVGFCGAGNLPVVYRYGPHHGEEPPISGWNGSGTVFFSGCPLRCIYCQNHIWSQTRPLLGETYTRDELSCLFLELQRSGCHNINLVTPEPWIPHIVSAVASARTSGMIIPVVYNTSGFVSPEALVLLAGTVDVYLTDIRYETPEQALALSSSGGYFQASREAARIMWHQVGRLSLDRFGIATAGMIIRHLVMPDQQPATEQSLAFIANELSSSVHVSLLTQYEPLYMAADHPRIGRRITPAEYRHAVQVFKQLGLWLGWKQPLSSPDPSLLGTAMKPTRGNKLQAEDVPTFHRHLDRFAEENAT